MENYLIGDKVSIYVDCEHIIGKIVGKNKFEKLWYNDGDDVEVSHEIIVKSEFGKKDYVITCEEDIRLENYKGQQFFLGDRVKAFIDWGSSEDNRLIEGDITCIEREVVDGECVMFFEITLEDGNSYTVDEVNLIEVA